MENQLHYALIRTYFTHRHRSRQEFQALDLSDGQPKILLHLLSGDGVLQKELSGQCGVRPATMTSLLQNMQSKGLVKKEETRVSGGKRGYLIFLTEKGRSLACQVKEIMEQVDEISFAGFSEQEKEETMRFLDRIVRNLQSEG